MLLVKLLLVAAMTTTVGLSTRFFSPQELQDSFEKGQKLYALGDYGRAIEHYQDILDTQSNAVIDVDEVTVAVDEYILPVRVAATYQLANTYNKQGLEKLRRSEFLRDEQKEEEAQERYTEALADLKTSLDYFSQIIRNERVDERTRVMAQFQMLETNYQLKRYEQVIEEGEKLLRNFPNSVYETAAHYNIGWSHFELGQYEEAIENFEQVLILSPRGSYADRAFFQISECYDRLGQYDQALVYLDRLIGRYDFSQMSEQEIIEMTTLKLKGLVKETSRELVAKAQIKKGDIFADKGEIDQALAAYAAVPNNYAAETALVQNSYIRTAELIHRERGTAAAIDAYKNAIENVDDRSFGAETQLTVARLLFEEGAYDKAAEEYRIYLNGYGDVAARIGFDRDKTLFRLGQCYQSQGRKLSGSDPDGAAAAFFQAVVQYRQLVDEYSDSPLVPDAFLGLGFCTQFQGQADAARDYFRKLVDDYPQHPATPTALLQLARLAFEAGDYEQARSVYESFLRRYPESGMRQTAYMELGLAYKRLGDIPSAITAFEAIPEGWDQWPKVQLQLAELYAGQQDYVRAEEVLRGALGRAGQGQLQSQLLYARGKALFAQADYGAAIGALDAALEQDPGTEILASALFTRGAAHYELAKQLDAEGDSTLARSHYEACLVDLKELLERDPAPQLKDSAFRTLGASMIRLGQAQEAARYYQEIIAGSANPQERATFQMLLTELFYDMQDFERAQQYARKLLEMKFTDDNQAGYFRKERAYAIIGNSLLQQKQYGEAAQNFAAGLQRYPNSGESANMAFSKGLAEFSGGDYQAAATSFATYLRRFPRHLNAVHGQYYLAHSYQALTQFGQAAEAFATLVERYPNSTYGEEALFLIGENLYNEQDFVRAVDAYRRYLDSYPRGQYGDDAQYALAWAYFEQEEMEPGVEAMKGLVEHFPQSEYASKAQFTIGDYYYNIRVYDKALVAYERVLEDYPRSEEAVKAESLVLELSEIQASFEYAEVMKLFDRKRYADAVTGFEQLVAKYPGTYTELASYCNMAMAYENMRRWEDAVENYDKILDKAGDDPESYDVASYARQHRDWIVENRL